MNHREKEDNRLDLAEEARRTLQQVLMIGALEKWQNLILRLTSARIPTPRPKVQWAVDIRVPRWTSRNLRPAQSTYFSHSQLGLLDGAQDLEQLTRSPTDWAGPSLKDEATMMTGNLVGSSNPIEKKFCRRNQIQCQGRALIARAAGQFHASGSLSKEHVIGVRVGVQAAKPRGVGSKGTWPRMRSNTIHLYLKTKSWLGGTTAEQRPAAIAEKIRMHTSHEAIPPEEMARRETVLKNDDGVLRKAKIGDAKDLFGNDLWVKIKNNYMSEIPSKEFLKRLFPKEENTRTNGIQVLYIDALEQLQKMTTTKAPKQDRYLQFRISEEALDWRNEMKRKIAGNEKYHDKQVSRGDGLLSRKSQWVVVNWVKFRATIGGNSR